ncbi:MAG TPA: hypothetical protein VK468_06105 [Pyrinomonadaceae bacterium]|nr:hypothetical protein [Pyrinomonadaceae bacterium]
MKQSQTNTFFLFSAVKAIVLILAIANFVFIWMHQKTQTSSTISFCGYCPWYENWTFTNEPSILLLSAFLILASYWWSYLSAAILSGYVLCVGIFSLLISDLGLLERWEGIQKYEVSLFLTMESQWILAGIIFGFGVLCLGEMLVRKSRREASSE